MTTLRNAAVTLGESKPVGNATAVTLAANFAADLAYFWLDPRVYYR